MAKASTVAKGRRGEQLAAKHLRAHGYRILETNYRIRQGEIDIIAEQGPSLCFVEVRSRRAALHGHPLETIDRRKQARIVRAAQHYLLTHRHEARPMRFDVLAIVYRPKLEIQLIQGAFDAGTTW